MPDTRAIVAALCAMTCTILCAGESAAQSVRPETGARAATRARISSLHTGIAPARNATRETIPIVRTRQGDLEGITTNGLGIFKGVPYATPPVGDLRWRSPKPPAPWKGVRKAEKFGDACVQNPKLSISNGGDPGPVSEDCLYLNVWTPDAKTAWPQYHANNDKTMEFGNTIAMRTNFMKSRLRALTGVLVIAAKTLGRSG